MQVMLPKNEGETKVIEWVIYYIDKDKETGKEFTNTIIYEYNEAALHSIIFHFGQKFKVTSIGVRESTVIKKTDSECNVSEKYAKFLDMWKEKHVTVDELTK